MIFIRRVAAFSTSKEIYAQKNAFSNITDHIIKCSDKKLYALPQHPLGILKAEIERFYKPQGFAILDELSPIVSV